MFVQRKSHTGITAMGIFLFFGAAMASLAGVTLIWRGTILDRMWAINAPANRRLAPFGKTVGIALLLLGATLVGAATGWFGHRLWGWRLGGSQSRNGGFGKAVEGVPGGFRSGRRR